VFSSPLIQELTNFVRGIGIEVHAASSLLPANFPGLDIQHGAILIDESRVVYPGDILHEAGHIAMSAPSVRPALRLNPSGGEELSTLGWSYAAAVHLGLDPSLVFYPASYDGFGDGLVDLFAAGNYIGVPLLQRFGMAVDARNAVARGVPPFPHMLRWLR